MVKMQVYYLSPLLLVGLFVVSYIIPIRFFLYGFICMVSACIIGHSFQKDGFKLPYYYDGKWENLNETNEKTVKSDKEVMFFVHGHPDNKELWDKQVEFFKKKYHCVTIDMPHYGDHVDGMSKWGYSMVELADIIASTIKRSLVKLGKEKAILVSFDWGATVSCIVAKKYPDLISKSIILDVIIDNFYIPYYIVFFLGMFYQYWLILAWMIALTVPFVGEAIGQKMNLAFQEINMAGPMPTPEKSYHRPNGKIGSSALANYLYFYCHVDNFLETFS